MKLLDSFLFIGLPYIAFFVFFTGTILRYTHRAFKVSSISSQFLEGKNLFWGSAPFHYGVLFLFVGHLIAFLVPSAVMAFNAHPLRLLIIEAAAMMAAISMGIGLMNLIMRRSSNDRLAMVTTPMDYTILTLLILQVISGLSVAYFFRWGSSWFSAVLSPYLWGIFTFQPDIEAVSALSWVIKTHIVGAFLIILLVPFSRLIHFLVPPLAYIRRPFQVVIWNWSKSKVRSTDTEWSIHRPKNN